jgi:hypothetical protein
MEEKKGDGWRVSKKINCDKSLSKSGKRAGRRNKSPTCDKSLRAVRREELRSMRPLYIGEFPVPLAIRTKKCGQRNIYDQRMPMRWSK